MRFEPIGADPGLDDDGDLQIDGVAHLFFDNRTNLLLFGAMQIKYQFVMDLEQALRIRTGDRLLVDGSAGRVEILARAAGPGGAG